MRYDTAASQFNRDSSVIHLAPTPVEPLHFEGHSLFIKRDDLQHPYFSGNKARKLYSLLNAPPAGITTLVCYGSCQSNALLSLAALARHHRWQLYFYVDHIPGYLQANPVGNYAQALALGATITAVGNARGERDFQDYVECELLPRHDNALFVPEGGRCELAEPGIRLLADEINQWAAEQGMDDIKVMLPSGTGTTALFLQKHLPFEVLTCACVGDDDYLRHQFRLLSDNPDHFPTILSSDKKYHFGKPYRAFYEMWQSLRAQTGVEFELLYDPLGWLTLLDYLQQRQNTTPVLYIHQGGILGNPSMLGRYRHKGFAPRP